MWTIDDEWRRAVVARMRELGVTRADLARACNVNPASITVMLRHETKQTRLKPCIHKALGFQPPESTAARERDAELERIRQGWDELSEAERAVVTAVFMRLYKPAPRR